jgi:hypothetical protein
MFSSVNMLFMLTVVLWISASFALFYIGGIPAAANTEVSEIESSTEPDDCNIVCCAVVSKGGSDSKRFTTADATIIISIAWNAALIIYVMIPKIQSDSNIPLNNVVLTIFSALAAIAVQWHWAYYSGKEHIQKNTNSSQEEAPASDGITEGYEVYRSRGNSRGVGRTKPIGSNDDDGYFDGSYNNKGPYRQERLKSMDSAFHTTNFLSVASKKMEQQSLLSKMTAMGYSQQEIMVELGAPFASQNYYRSIKVSFVVFNICVVSIKHFSDLKTNIAEADAPGHSTMPRVCHHHPPHVGHPSELLLPYSAHRRGAAAVHHDADIPLALYPCAVPLEHVQEDEQGLRRLHTSWVPCDGSVPATRSMLRAADQRHSHQAHLLPPAVGLHVSGNFLAG